MPPSFLNDTSHRPWPLPPRRWALAMRWHDLAFLHWPVPPAELRDRIPPGLELDTFEGEAWLGIVPFRMSGVRPRLVPAVPGMSSFPEINLRTYVTAGGKAGVWFFSLDVPERLAVLVARRRFHLPYFRARMELQHEGEALRYASERITDAHLPGELWLGNAHHRGQGEAAFAARYRPTGAVVLAAPDSLEAWLCERYCLYSRDARGTIHRGEIHHAPWPLQTGEVELERSAFTEQIGLPAPRSAPVVHFARELDVVVWSLQPA